MKLTKETHIKDLKELKNSYDNLYSNQVLKESQKYYRWIVKVLSPQQGGKKLLDVACGAGFFLKELTNLPIFSVGFDISEIALKKARENSFCYKLICGAGEFLPFKNESFDYVVNLGSLEHFLEPDKGVREMVRVLKKDGKCLVFVPNSYFLMTILNVWRTGSTGRETPQPIDRWATKKEWIDLLEKNGLNVEKVLKHNYSTPKDPLKYRLLRPFIPLNLSYSFLFVCSKK
ncbi:MAG: class I SAM-dependent methyltransferase [Candidatus Aminicenantia bacterium]